ncbi:MAG: ATP-dependent DNA helicase RecG [Lachnospiraceae bacterium]|nr:ATP-dependent DNA helicase RecG [Lachnospiraceae bacterium]
MLYNECISVVKGIGEKTQKIFNKMEIYTVGDLLEYYPRNYDIYKTIVPINTVRQDETITIEGFISDSIQLKKVRNLAILSCRIQDSTDSIKVMWFNMPYLKNQIKLGARVILRGNVSRKNGMLTMVQPKILSKEEYYKTLNIMNPIYSLTSGISNQTILKAVRSIIDEVEFNNEYLPFKFRKKYDLIEYKKAVKNIHFPKNKEDLIEARHRLVFDEFFMFILALAKLKEDKTIAVNNFNINNGNKIKDEFIKKLPYTLTGAQLRTIEEVIKDLESNKSMNRLIQGDVGSGKTVVSAIALLIVALSGYQGVVMVPTEVLAKQHYESLKEFYKDYDINVGLLVGSMTAKEKREMYASIKANEVDIIVGTHALIQEKVEYNNLALVVTDEQHRFGVKQRENLAGRGNGTHVLVMSATPIPRTLAIILYGDLDISIIDELPSNRLPIKNCVVDNSYRKTAYNFITKEISAGRQAYVICPMVEESEAIEAENVTDYAKSLEMELPPFINVGVLHGKMKAKEKQEVMQDFFENKTQVLVSTTVVEVGVNVPNATVMMIENAERFGLAQLHQLRGRVGRGKHQSYCIMISDHQSEDTKKRLEIMNKSNDGFYIASEDMKLRGPGDLFGIRQSGDISFKISDIFTDAHVLKQANDAIKEASDKELEEIISNNAWIDNKLKKYVGHTTL